MQHLGDIKKIKGGSSPPVDCIIGGSPCQNLSIAGNRKGLSGSESCLFMEQIRIVKEMRDANENKYPRYMVWENVPGAFSSNKGRDFQQVLTEIARIAEPEAPMCLCLKKDIQHGESSMTWTEDGALLGELLMRNTGECPNVVVESRLSQILQETAPEKYYLSPRACQGILTRAAKRGKQLPKELEMALLRQSMS